MYRLVYILQVLGLFFITGPKLKTSTFYRAFNSIMGKIGRLASNEVTVSLIKAKCLPILLYETETCHFSVRETTSLECPISCALIKGF